MPKEIIISKICRWPIKQTGDNTFDIVIPTGPLAPHPLNAEFVELMRLSDHAQDMASRSVLEAIAFVD